MTSLRRWWWIPLGFVAVPVLTLVALWTSTRSVIFPTQSLEAHQQRMDLSMALALKSGYTSGIAVTKSAETNRSTAPKASLTAVGNAATLSKCFPFNTAKWLRSERIRNNDRGVDLLSSFQILLPPPTNNETFQPPQYQAALEQTLCRREAPFLATTNNAADTTTTTTTTTQTDAHDEKMVKIWTTRVVYLSILFHQHYQAWEEFQHRSVATEDSSCQQAWQEFQMSPVDFECPKAKFLVIPLGDNGLGANFRLGAMAVLKTALASGRIALYINHFNESQHRWLQKPWTLVSCHRRDYQCFFLPPSPCVLTHQDYLDAHILDKVEMRTLFRQGSLPHLENERVWVYSPTFRPQREPPLMRDRLVRIGKFLIQQGLLPDTPMLHRAIHRINSPVNEQKTAFEGDDELAGGLLLYVSRPRSPYLKQLHMMTMEPPSDPSKSIGLPIRASDKCMEESECFPFEKYLQAAQAYWLHMWPDTPNGTRLSVLVTTESTDVLQQKLSWTKRQSAAPWEQLSFEMLHNPHDVTQDTGLVRAVKSDRLTADQVMLSSLSSLRAQLMHRIVLGNCCSNFHRLIQILVRSGCSSHWDAEFVCLQHHPVETFRLCCAWDKSDRCRARLGKNSSKVET